MAKLSNYNWPFVFIKGIIADFYWCNIPMYCRECNYLDRCRYGFKQKRKCINGCLKRRYMEELEKDTSRTDL